MALGTSCEPEPPGARVGRQCPGERSEHGGLTRGEPSRRRDVTRVACLTL